MSNKITFTNNTDLPINIETWINKKHGISEMKEITVYEYETIEITSATGEWFLNSYINDKIMKEKWIISGYNLGIYIGKFRNTPCSKGKYSWINYDLFDITYNPNTCNAIFSIK